jgi:hypothetical protein
MISQGTEHLDVGNMENSSGKVMDKWPVEFLCTVISAIAFVKFVSNDVFTSVIIPGTLCNRFALAVDATNWS